MARRYRPEIRERMARVLNVLEEAGSQGIAGRDLMQSAKVAGLAELNGFVTRLRQNRCRVEYDRATGLWRLTRRGPDPLGDHQPPRATGTKIKRSDRGVGLRRLAGGARQTRRRALSAAGYAERREVLSAFLANPDHRLQVLPSAGSLAPDDFHRRVATARHAALPSDHQLG